MAVRTKQAIRQAFIELLNERPLDKISVKDIAERSTVNRNTFYYYYADIYALVEEIFQTETQLFMEKLRSYASWEEAFREATAFVSENKRAVHHLFNSGNRNILEHYYHKVTYAAMLSYVRGQAEGLNAAEEDIQALAQFYAAALSGMTADWLRGGMKSNVNDHIDRLGRLLEGNIRQALERSCRLYEKRRTDPGGGGPPYVLLCACGSGQGVFGGVALKLAAEGVRIAVRRAERFVQIEIVLRGVDDAAGDVGAVVGGALEVREQIGPDEAGLDAAMPLLHPQDVARAHLLLERVDDLLERLDQLGEGDVLPLERAQREVEDLPDGGGEHVVFTRGCGGEGERLAAQLLGGFENVHGMVGNALKVPDGL